ncbi:MAG TPA: undecaprenyl-phosphate glucose phosphotransferase [Paucimonas sp.]|nr:undecaprenyl-phosphate glucose phosphotransferase [Paucimonas sp.]
MRLMDVIALVVAGHLAGYLHFRTPLIEAAPVHTILLYFCGGLGFLLFPQLEVYTSWRGRSIPTMVLRLAGAWGLVLLIGVLFSFLIHHVGALSRLWSSYWYLSGLLLLTLSRAIVHTALGYMRKKGMNIKRVVIVGYGAIGREMHKRAEQHDWYGYEVKAIHAEAEDALHLRDPGIARLSRMEEIPRFAAAHGVDEIWITLPMSASAELRQLQRLLRNALVDIRWVPDTLSMQMLSCRMIDFMGFPAVDLNTPVSAGLGGVVKELFDKAFALTALVLLAPLFLVIAILIKLSSPGPVFFRQPRLGLNGRPFKVYKFRSMKPHAEQGVVVQATPNDPRITNIGRFLRRTSLDELPQFINVLKGEMSVVGPRPHALQHNEMYKDLLELYMLRHRVKPGITGWAQIHGYRGETDTVDKMAKRVQFDLHYIQNWSLWMDLKIIVWTAFKGWTGDNVY